MATYGRDARGEYKIRDDGTKVYRTPENTKYFPTDYGGTAGWSTTSAIDSSGRYVDTGAPAWLGLNPDGSVKQKTTTSKRTTGTITDYNIDKYTDYNIDKYIEELTKAQRQSVLAGLDKARRQAVSALQAEKAQIQPQYYDKRNQANVAMNQAGRNFAEFLAQRGLQSSGVAAQGELSNLSAYQRTLGELGRQEQQAYDDIARRMTDVESAYLADLQAAEAGLQAQQMQALIAEMQRQRDLALQQEQFNRQFGLQEAGLTGTYQGTPTLDALNAQRQFALQEAGLTGLYQGNPTLDALNTQRQYELNLANLLGEYQGTPTLAAQAQQWSQGGFANAYDLWRAQRELEQQYAKELENLNAVNRLRLASAKDINVADAGLTKTEAKDINVAEYRAAIDNLINQASRYITDSLSNYKVYSDIIDRIDKDSQILRAGGLTNSDIENLKKYVRTKMGL